MANEYWRKGITKVYFTPTTLTTDPPAEALDGVGQDEVQTITITGTPTGGNFTLTFDGEETANIAYNADASAVDSALEALSNIPAGGVTCGGGPLPGTPVTVTFTGGLAKQDVSLMTADDDGLTGGTAPAVAVSLTTPGYSPATNLTPQINGMDGWETQVERIPTENLANTFTPTITGPRTVSDASITFLDQKNPSSTTPADYDAIRATLDVGTRGTLVICPYGNDVGSRCELWPVESSGPNDIITLANEPAKYRVDFGITGLPVKDAELGA